MQVILRRRQNTFFQHEQLLQAILDLSIAPLLLCGYTSSKAADLSAALSLCWPQIVQSTVAEEVAVSAFCTQVKGAFERDGTYNSAAGEWCLRHKAFAR